MDEIPTKTCLKCKNVLPLDGFTKNMRSRDGHAGWCRACMSIKYKTIRNNNRDKICARQRAWYANHKNRYQAYRASLKEKRAGEPPRVRSPASLEKQRQRMAEHRKNA